MVSSKIATVSFPLTPTKNLERSLHVIKGLKVADVILGMTFLCHENATINCAEKRVIFPDNDFVQCNDKGRVQARMQRRYYLPESKTVGYDCVSITVALMKRR